MTALDFMTACQERLIDPGIALENNLIVEALKEGFCNEMIERLLDEVF